MHNVHSFLLQERKLVFVVKIRGIGSEKLVTEIGRQTCFLEVDDLSRGAY